MNTSSATGNFLNSSSVFCGVLLWHLFPFSKSGPAMGPEPLDLGPARPVKRKTRIRAAAAAAISFIAVILALSHAPLAIARESPPDVGPAVKRGLSLAYPNCEDASHLMASWTYNWSPTAYDCPGLDNVPMLYGGGDTGPAVHGSSHYLLGCNEPDIFNQCNMTPEQMVAPWHRIEERFADRLLVAPAPSHLDPEWIVRFRDAYLAMYQVPPRLDGLAVHCYLWDAQQCIALTQKYLVWAREWGVPEVWVTEFAFSACGGRSIDQTAVEARRFIAWMDAEPMVTRYAWFTNRIRPDEAWILDYECVSPLFDSSGRPTAFFHMLAPSW